MSGGMSGGVSWTVAGYDPVRELGHGASGTVVLARHADTGRPVAIKYLDAALAGDDGFLTGFRAEARLLGEVGDPHVARFYEYVQVRGQAAIVLEFVDGVPLRALLTEHAPLSAEAALSVLKGSLLGLAAAHEQGVVHRDYKPENVLVTPVGTTKLVDFGVAVRAGRDVPAAGTPQYMAPEQWSGQAASPATDVYAATCVFVECVTGHPAFAASTADALRRQHLAGEAQLAGLPEALRGLVRAGLAKDGARRPADARALVGELERVARAEYGDDWEARGRRELRKLVLLLAALLPAGGVAAGGLAAFARTVLGGGRWAAVGVVGAVLIGGTAAATATGDSPRRVAGPVSLATSSPSPPGGPSSTTPASVPSSSVRPATSARPSPRTSRPAGTATPGSSGTGPGPRASSPAPRPRSSPAPHRPTPRPSSSTRRPSSPPPPAPLTITILDKKSRLDQVGTTTDGDVSVAITAGDGRPFTVTIDYSDGSSSSFTESGSTFYGIHQTHAFPGCGGTWSFTVTTSPAAGNQPVTVSTVSSC